jgi:hypothetical protein
VNVPHPNLQIKTFFDLDKVLLYLSNIITTWVRHKIICGKLPQVWVSNPYDLVEKIITPFA